MYSQQHDQGKVVTDNLGREGVVFSLSHEEIRGRAKSRRAERERERDREREGETTADKRLLTTPHKNRVPRTDILSG
jgi:septal ring factor EnvC (AmiA/AmiB activator)